MFIRITSILCLFPIVVFGRVSIVASTSDLASIANYIGGDQVVISHIAQENGDYHRVDIRPSYMMRVAKADIYLKIGMGLDYWADNIIDGARNTKLSVVNCSNGIIVLDKPLEPVTKAQGDIHPEGNPHYWLSPLNGKVIAKNVHEALVKVDPKNADYYSTNLQEFNDKLDQKLIGWKNKSKQFSDLEIIAFHSTWVYFTDVFGPKVVGYLEPFPGIEPTANHTKKIVDLIIERSVKLIVIEHYNSMRTSEAISKMIDCDVAQLVTTVGANDRVQDWFALMDYLVDTFSNFVTKEIK